MPIGGTAAVDLNGNTADSLILSKSVLQALMAQLSNAGVSVTVQATSLPTPTATTMGTAMQTQVNGKSAIVQYSPSNVAAAEASGQDPAEILYHELDHVYYETQTGYYNNPPATTTFAINGATYNYSTALVPLPSTPGAMTQSTGFDGWEHMLIHNDVVNAFQGADKTAALEEGLSNATNPPANIANVVATDTAKTGISSRAESAPSLSAVCKSPTQAQRRVHTASSTTYVDSWFLDTY
jgi:hypothetical protein